jgi:bacterial/archaeal transporter family-2 protein
VDELRTGRVFLALAEPEGMSRAVAFLCTLAVGGLIALQPPANAALARHVGDLGAALISALIKVSILAVLLLVFSEPTRLSGLASFKPQYAIGGIGGAAVVAVSLVAVRPLGVAGVVSLLVAGQLVISVLADRLGWFGVAQVGLTPTRLAGAGTRSTSRSSTRPRA